MEPAESAVLSGGQPGELVSLFLSLKLTTLALEHSTLIFKTNNLINVKESKLILEGTQAFKFCS